MFTLTLNTDNAAFEDYSAEVARILRTAADRIENGVGAGSLADANGNAVGSFNCA